MNVHSKDDGVFSSLDDAKFSGINAQANLHYTPIAMVTSDGVTAPKITSRHELLAIPSHLRVEGLLAIDKYVHSATPQAIRIVKTLVQCYDTVRSLSQKLEITRQQGYQFPKHLQSPSKHGKGRMNGKRLSIAISSPKKFTRRITSDGVAPLKKDVLNARDEADPLSDDHTPRGLMSQSYDRHVTSNLLMNAQPEVDAEADDFLHKFLLGDLDRTDASDAFGPQASFARIVTTLPASINIKLNPGMNVDFTAAFTLELAKLLTSTTAITLETTWQSIRVCGSGHAFTLQSSDMGPSTPFAKSLSESDTPNRVESTMYIGQISTSIHDRDVSLADTRRQTGHVRGDEYFLVKMTSPILNASTSSTQQTLKFQYTSLDIGVTSSPQKLTELFGHWVVKEQTTVADAKSTDSISEPPKFMVDFLNSNRIFDATVNLKATTVKYNPIPSLQLEYIMPLMQAKSYRNVKTHEVCTNVLLPAHQIAIRTQVCRLGLFLFPINLHSVYDRSACF